MMQASTQEMGGRNEHESIRGVTSFGKGGKYAKAYLNQYERNSAVMVFNFVKTSQDL